MHAKRFLTRCLIELRSLSLLVVIFVFVDPSSALRILDARPGPMAISGPIST